MARKHILRAQTELEGIVASAHLAAASPVGFHADVNRRLLGPLPPRPVQVRSLLVLPFHGSANLSLCFCIFYLLHVLLMPYLHSHYELMTVFLLQALHHLAGGLYGQMQSSLAGITHIAIENLSIGCVLSKHCPSS